MNTLPTTSKKKSKLTAVKFGVIQRIAPDALFSFFTANIIKDQVKFTR